LRRRAPAATGSAAGYAQPAGRTRRAAAETVRGRLGHGRVHGEGGLEILQHPRRAGPSPRAEAE
jgi:hypothetical protein